MTSQHVVNFGDSVRLTRMPPGRAEGRIWLHFAISGIGWDDTGDLPGPSSWRWRDHVTVTGDNGPLESRGGGEGSDGRLTVLQREFVDDGSRQVTIRYRHEDTSYGEETIDLPEWTLP